MSLKPQWSALRARSRSRRFQVRHVRSINSRLRRSFVEPLEDRRLLAIFGPTEPISVDHLGTSSGSSTSVIGGMHRTLSEDGRYQVFQSDATDLDSAIPDGNGSTDVFVRDRLTNATTLISRNATGTGSGNWYSITPTISADGRYVAFASGASDLDPLDASFLQDIFLFDRVTETTRLVSVNHAGTSGGNHHSYNPSVAVDGMGHVWVAFESYSDDLVSGISDSNFTLDLFLRDVTAGTTRLVSVNSAGTDTGNSESYDAQLSADGARLVFQSYASNLVSSVTDNNGTIDILVHDVAANSTAYVSTEITSPAAANLPSTAPARRALSSDGRYEVFESGATDLVPGMADVNGHTDVFLRDLLMGTTILVSRNATGTGSGNWYSTTPAISADGRYVAFASAASDLDPLDASFLQDIFLFDRVTETTQLVSVNHAGTAGGNHHSYNPSVAVDGMGHVWVAFESYAADLSGISDSNGTLDMFLRDVTVGTTRLVSVNSAGTDTGNSQSYDAQLSADGARLVFQSYASNLVAAVTDNNGTIDILVHDVGANSTAYVSTEITSPAAANLPSTAPARRALSSDGRYEVFESSATDVVPGMAD